MSRVSEAMVGEEEQAGEAQSTERPEWEERALEKDEEPQGWRKRWAVGLSVVGRR